MMTTAISPTTLRTWMDGAKRVCVVDVRDDDYNQGGHIRGAVNFPSANFTKSFEDLVETSASAEAVVFHCQFSQVRGPQCARYYESKIKALDSFKGQEVCVLSGGFNSWYDEFACTKYIER
ncbi:Rhodanese-like domain-containing protein [Yarrowia lipolytica]|jgi:rhodanese-related sulfurtransferase|uniref:arsenate reductase (glutathione/glutaredoxin) n=3 Tax=Yarrowia lipolytica TaxID=4952 RepID=Q6C8N3_YARLI|nr:YALI0D18293p [Yarrowia lipolytica CLIB122]AOW04250.1 hypothetical protein YALI1_D22864g [Yarrowia lipolytica]KAB8281180.1 Rhodanese-like domain-containing protein [Yarrowia lipolytica]KAE8170720.1 Rhodanese-like domain-containing protein [Yarrowia lipolytica]KAJ8054238.1 Rhodanese-like domain-containing protein [Yarrowia lipolytica]QNP98328.1 Dual specificity phosphatase Cdc25 [Yarrowia lipolytica]|eukprot:XP_502979.1 YALI0D18293p [Yarrowia lipolytica CLIB122]